MAGKDYGLYKLLQQANDEPPKEWQKTHFAYALSLMKTTVITVLMHDVLHAPDFKQ